VARYAESVALGRCPWGADTHQKPTGDHVFCDDCLSKMSETNAEGYRWRIDSGFCAAAMSHKKPRKKEIFCDACLASKAKYSAATYAQRVKERVCPNNPDHDKPLDGSVYCEACKAASREADARIPRYCRNNPRHARPAPRKRLCEECRTKVTPAARRARLIKRGFCAKGGELHPRPIHVNGKRKTVCEDCIAREVKRQREKREKAVA